MDPVFMNAELYVRKLRQDAYNTHPVHGGRKSGKFWTYKHLLTLEECDLALYYFQLYESEYGITREQMQARSKSVHKAFKIRFGVYLAHGHCIGWICEICRNPLLCFARVNAALRGPW